MDMNRRQLFRFGAAAVLTAVVTPVALAENAPILWGDGVHDDAHALQAAIDGTPVTIAGHCIIIRNGDIVGGDFLVSKTIVVENRKDFWFQPNSVTAKAPFSGSRLMFFGDGNERCMFDLKTLDTSAISPPTSPDA